MANIEVHCSASGLLNVNKPSGVTSFWVVNRIRKILKVKKAGHCGTLDPAAQGVLLVLFGSATKLQSQLMASKKIYRTKILTGKTTDTGDIAGKILSEKPAPVYSDKAINEVLEKFKGEISQVPPMYSALKVNGRKLYEYARAGETVERKPRPVNIYEITMLSYEAGRIELRVACSSGTYIRVLAEDIGNELGCGATMESLVREEVSPFNIADSIEFDRLKAMAPDTIISNSMPLEAINQLIAGKI